MTTTTLAFTVPKSKIAENGDYNLTGDRYREVVDYSNAKWPMVELGELEKQEKIKFLRGQGISKKDIIENGKNKCIHYGEIYTLYQPIIKNVISKTDFEGNILSKKGDVLIPSTTTADAMGIAVARSLNENGVILGGDINIIRTENKYVLSDYLALLISTPPLKNQLATYAKGVNILHISNSDIKNLKIPLPPLAVQEQIVAEIEQYQKVIDGAKQVVQNYKPSFRIDPSWEMVELGEVFQTITPPNKIQKGYYKTTGKYPIIDQSQDGIAGWTDDESSLVKSEKDLVIFGDHTCVIKHVNFPFVQGADGIKILKTNDDLLPKFLYFALKTKPLESDGYQRHFTKLKLYKIPRPPLPVQEQIVAEIEAEQKIVNGNKKLIEKMEKKIKARIGEVWGEEI
jgi:type I restriction enzyme M protein